MWLEPVALFEQPYCLNETTCFNWKLSEAEERGIETSFAVIKQAAASSSISCIIRPLKAAPLIKSSKML